MLALEDEALVAAEQLDEHARRWRARGFEHPVELLQLLEADRAAHLERPDVVAGQDEPVGLEEVVVVGARTAGCRAGTSRAQPWLRIARARLVDLGLGS